MEDLLELLRALSEPVNPTRPRAPVEQSEQVSPIPADRLDRDVPWYVRAVLIDPDTATAIAELKATEADESPEEIEAGDAAAEPAEEEPETEEPAPEPVTEPLEPADASPEESTTGDPPLPRQRPAPEAEPVEPETAEAMDDVPAEPPEPPRIFQTGCPAVMTGAVEAEMLPPMTEGQCMIRSPLSVTALSVNGRMLPLSSPVTVGCEVATALPGWVADVENYFVARENTRVETLLTGTSYMCRNVNNAGEGRLSEHAFGNAVDIVGFALEDGRSVTLPEGWADPLSVEGRALRFAHDAACSRFMTTLGPEANALHRDHLHLDMGCHGERCEARLCE
jgi:hypothetical protein